MTRKQNLFRGSEPFREAASIYSVHVCINRANPASAETDPRAYQQPLECLVKPVLSLWEAYSTPAAFWHASLEPFCVTYPSIHLHAEWQGKRKCSTIRESHLLTSGGFTPTPLFKNALFKASFLSFTQNWFAPAAS